MEELLERLRDWGCDVEGTMDRFMGDGELYETCLHAVTADKAFAGLGEALKVQQVKEAFDYAHTLKGVLANMGLTPMLDIVVEIVEPLRGGSCEGLLPLYEQLVQSNERLKQLIG